MKNILIIGSTGQIGSELTMHLRGIYGNEHVVAGYIPGAEPKGELLESGPSALADVIKARGYRTGKEHYVQTLAQSLALFAMAFYGKKIVYRTTDFKSNEYRNLIGGNLFEMHRARAAEKAAAKAAKVAEA